MALGDYFVEVACRPEWKLAVRHEVSTIETATYSSMKFLEDFFASVVWGVRCLGLKRERRRDDEKRFATKSTPFVATNSPNPNGSNGVSFDVCAFNMISKLNFKISKTGARE